MPLSRLTEDAVRLASNTLLEHCDQHTLERTLSNQNIYLECQSELIELSDNDRHQRLAELVAYTLGDGLLRIPELREKLCVAIGIDSPSSFRSGSPQAIKMCQDLNLPHEFAGVLPPLQISPVRRVRQFKQIPKLMDFQLELLQKGKVAIDQQKSCLISIPTGAGKTLVGTLLQRNWHEQQEENSTSIWIAHTEELCVQAAECVEQVWQDPASDIQTGTIIRAWGSTVSRLTRGSVYIDGESSGSVPSHTVIISTPQSAIRIINDAKYGTIKLAIDKLGLLIIDEAHRAGATTYRQLITQSASRFSGIRLFGLSATPVRDSYSSNVYKGTDQLTQLFDRLIEPTDTLSSDQSTVKQLQARGVLANLEIRKMKFGYSNFKKRIEQVALELHDRDSVGILFANSIAQAKLAAVYLREFGTSADYVASDSTSADRSNLVTALKQGYIQILTNCEILTTGFDAPRVSDIYLFRNTKSPVLYKQMIGRGLRGPEFGGANSCRLHLCGFDLDFDPDPNTSKFARAVWTNS